LTLSPHTNLDDFRVAILGRANVGKSTLFNRLLGKRRAITHQSPGVTRDAVEAKLQIRDLNIILIDSGGYSRGEGTIEKKVAARSTSLAESSDLVLAVVSVEGLNSEDLDFVEKLRPFQEKTLLVVNKVDGEKQSLNIGEFYSLGLPRVVAVSAAHGRNIGVLKDLIYQAAGEHHREESEIPETSGKQDVIRLTILGKPNTGKSTLLNRLLEAEKSLVTDIPGTTRDPVEGGFHYKGHPIQVIDTAGIRRKSKVNESVEYYSVNRSIKSIEEAEIALLIIDAREGISDQDKKIAALAARKGRGIVLVLNKWDALAAEVNDKEAEKRWRELSGRTRFLFPTLGFAPLIRISALTGSGIGQLLETVLAVSGQLNRRIATPRLNKALRSWTADYPLPVRGKNVKIRYGTQTGVNPVCFLFFVNNMNSYPKRYNKYLMNRIRQDLGFDKIPVSVDLRES